MTLDILAAADYDDGGGWCKKTVKPPRQAVNNS